VAETAEIAAATSSMRAISTRSSTDRGACRQAFSPAT
jgi:hypothetical protein